MTKHLTSFFHHHVYFTMNQERPYKQRPSHPSAGGWMEKPQFSPPRRHQVADKIPVPKSPIISVMETIGPFTILRVLAPGDAYSTLNFLFYAEFRFIFVDDAGHLVGGAGGQRRNLVGF